MPPLRLEPLKSSVDWPELSASTSTVAVLETVSLLSTSRLSVVANSSLLLVTEVASMVSVPPLASSKPELLIEPGSMVSVPLVASSVPVAGDGDGRAVDGAGAGRIEKPVDVDECRR